jgi:methylase of polypeptide subunit release factors
MQVPSAAHTDSKPVDHFNALPAADQALVRLAKYLRKSGYRFITVTPDTHQRVNARAQNEWAMDLAGVFGWSRRFRPSILHPEIFELMRLADIVVPDGEGWRSLLRLSTLDGELYFHSAYPTSDADAVFFGPDTYRFATAIKRYFASQRLPVRSAVDIGCGAGPGAILTALAHPGAQVVAVDINDRALRLTRVNAYLAGVANIATHNSNLLTDVSGEFDLIVANPPFLVDPTERAYRNGGGALGSNLSLAIVDAALNRLTQHGTLLMYTGVAIVGGIDLFLAAVEKRLAAHNAVWSYEELDPDIFGEELDNAAYADADRIAAVLLTVTKAG